MLQYILECIAFQLVFLIIYDLFLKRETFFQWNRLYLIGTYIISMVLPWIKIEAMKTTVPQSFQAYPEFLWNADDVAVTATNLEEASFTISWEYALLFGGMFLATLFFGYKLFQIYTLKRKGEVHYFKDFTQIIIANSSVAFSFFKSIFLGDRVIAKEHQSIVQHELVHIRQRHSYDLMFFELMRIVGWFNPLVYIYQSRVSELHEFIADAQVAKTSKKEQYEFLLAQVFQTQHISFINQFFKSSLIKKRIVMLQKNQSKRIWKLKYLLLLPISLVMLAYTSIEIEQKKIGDEVIALTSEIIIVNDIENLSEEEEGVIFNRLKSLSENSKDWVLFVKDKNSTMKFIPSIDSSYISGPNGERIKAKLVIDSRLKSKEASEFEEILEKMQQSKSDLEYYSKQNEEKRNLNKKLNALKQYNQLVEERKRLLKSTNEKNPIIVNLDQQLSQLREALGESIRGSVDGFNKKSNNNDDIDSSKGQVISQYNQLVAERQRLLQSSNERNPIIVNLDAQLERLREEISQESETVPFATIDEVPVFPGCEDADNRRECFNKMMQKHISKNFNYPIEAQEKGIQGRVAVMFTIAKDGSIQNIRERGPDSLLENEAHRIIKRLPKMQPGKQKGKVVNVPFSIPISFKLQEESDNQEPLTLRIRGDEGKSPLIIIDGKESTYEFMKNMNPDDIATMNVIKDGIAIKEYGEKGKNGVVEITLKKHEELSSKKIVSNGSSPLVFIDGKESSKEFDKLDQTNFEYIGVFKKEYAIKKYGKRGENGVIEVLTKAFFNSNAKLAKVHSQLRQLRKERSRLLENSKDDNPIIKKLDDQVDSLQKEEDKLVKEQLKKN